MLMHYLSHPFTGDEIKNRAETERIQRELQEKFPHVLYVSPIANFKALGNGMAQPCADWVIRRIKEATT